MSDKDFQVLDTAVVQVRSLMNFMFTLGYTLDALSSSGRFVTDLKGFQGNRYISTANAVRLHNSNLESWSVYSNEDSSVLAVFPEGVGFQVGFAPVAVRLAFASKLVDQVKFSVTRKGGLVIQDNMVKPLNKAILDLVEPKA